MNLVAVYALVVAVFFSSGIDAFSFTARLAKKRGGEKRDALRECIEEKKNDIDGILEQAGDAAAEVSEEDRVNFLEQISNICGIEADGDASGELKSKLKNCFESTQKRDLKSFLEGVHSCMEDEVVKRRQGKGRKGEKLITYIESCMEDKDNSKENFIECLPLDEIPEDLKSCVKEKIMGSEETINLEIVLEAFKSCKNSDVSEGRRGEIREILGGVKKCMEEKNEEISKKNIIDCLEENIPEGLRNCVEEQINGSEEDVDKETLREAVKTCIESSESGESMESDEDKVVKRRQGKGGKGEKLKGIPKDVRKCLGQLDEITIESANGCLPEEVSEDMKTCIGEKISETEKKPITMKMLFEAFRSCEGSGESGESMESGEDGSREIHENLGELISNVRECMEDNEEEEATEDSLIDCLPELSDEQLECVEEVIYGGDEDDTRTQFQMIREVFKMCAESGESGESMESGEGGSDENMESSEENDFEFVKEFIEESVECMIDNKDALAGDSETDIMELCNIPAELAELDLPLAEILASAKEYFIENEAEAINAFEGAHNIQDMKEVLQSIQHSEKRRKLISAFRRLVN